MSGAATAPAPASPEAQAPLLTVTNLSVQLRLADGALGAAVNDVSIELDRGEILGIVGESGSGKTMTALSIVNLLPAGAVRRASAFRFDGVELSELSERGWNGLRGADVSMVFQDPLSALNPVRTVGAMLRAAHRRHHGSTRAEATEAAIRALTAAGVPGAADRLRSYAHELSGGLRQRVLLALALINEPALLIADEPTTALDATVRSQLLRLLRTSAADRAMIFITHDLEAATSLCHRIVVMYAGRIVEDGPVEAVLRAPAHPYTAALLDARPTFGKSRRSLTAIPGAAPPIGTRIVGCAFAPRCARRDEACATRPELTPRGAGSVACWHPRDRPATRAGQRAPGSAPGSERGGEGS